jgi:hypothetical protein
MLLGVPVERFEPSTPLYTASSGSIPRFTSTLISRISPLTAELTAKVAISPEGAR